MIHLYYEQEQLHLEGHGLNSLADRFGTPFFLISESCLRDNYQSLLRGLDSMHLRAAIRYCAKTNNETGVLSILASLGSQVLASHLGEVQLALASGFPPDRLSFQRPVLLESEACKVLDAGVELFQVQDFQDIRTLQEAASACNRKVKVSLRLRNDARFYSRRMGFAEADIIKAASDLQSTPHLTLTGINFYGGSQQEDVRNFFLPLQKMTRLAAEISSRFGIILQEIDIGGGMPSYSLMRNTLRRLPLRLRNNLILNPLTGNLESYGKVLSEQFVKECDLAGLNPRPALVAEPGRAIAGNAAVLIIRVRAVRGNWLFVDASRNHIAESFLQFMRQMIPAIRKHQRGSRIYHIAGNTLNTMDIIDLYRRLPEAADGDVLVFCDAGAYTVSRAARYAGLLPPVYLIRTDGSICPMRRAENLSDLMGPMLPLQDR
jgi:diaminopimelate decarboxylase